MNTADKALLKDLKEVAKKHGVTLINSCTHCGATDNTNSLTEENMMVTLVRKTPKTKK